MAVFIGVAHAFVLIYEEPTLHRMFGDEYPRVLPAGETLVAMGQPPRYADR